MFEDPKTELAKFWELLLQHNGLNGEKKKKAFAKRDFTLTHTGIGVLERNSKMTIWL